MGYNEGMIIVSLAIAIISLIALCWLLGKEGDTWFASELKLLVFFLVVFAAAASFEYFPIIVPIFVGVALAVTLLINHLPGLKRLISDKLFVWMQPRVPRISETERSVIDSGDLSWEKDLFCGNYRDDVYDQVPAGTLTNAEKKFLKEETEELCRICSPTALVENKGLPPAAFEYIKKNKFWGMIIPRAFGGLAFSATAQSAIIAKLASRSSALGVMVMVPNSLGPGELIMHYGTPKQKKDYLPRLASGEEIPCFALTSQEVGSDAGGLEDFGILTEKTVNGKKVLGFEMNFNKRYISLAPVATIIGVAFRAYDPKGLLHKAKKKSDATSTDVANAGDKNNSDDLGITCALIPRNAKGVTIGRRHNPLDVLFHNGPIQGKNVFVPLDDIIGGKEYVGKGWQMLIDCLSIGRGISLPSLANAGTQLTAFSSAFYTNMREQFNLPVAKFEGVAENLGKLAINSYVVQAISENASAMVANNLKPAIGSAMAKYAATNIMRESTTMAMDVHGGKTIMKGSKNYMDELYRSVPIGITVEGANILTRSMIIFGQGFLRCHPYLRGEAEAISSQDKDEFHKLLWQHYQHVTKIKARSYGASLSGGWTLYSGGGDLGKHHRRLATLSAQFAFIVEMALIFIGGDIKRREAISGRFADAWMAMQAGVAAIRKYENEGKPKEALPLLLAVLTQMESKTQAALIEIMDNFPANSYIRALIKTAKIVMFPFGNYYKSVSDKELLKLADNMADHDWVMKNLAPDLYLGDSPSNPLALLQEAYLLTGEFLELKKRVKKGGHSKEPFQSLEAYLAGLMKDKIITAKEKALWLKAHQKIQEVISVDDFAA